MKILIIGSNEVYAMEHFFVKHLSALSGTDVVLLAMNEWIRTNINLFLKLERRLFPSRNTLYSGLNRFLLAQVANTKPDVILVFKGMEIYPETLQLLRAQGIVLTNFNPDHPFIITSRGSGNKNVSKSIGLYDLHFCYSRAVADRIQKQYKVPSLQVPFGFELPEFWQFSPLEEEQLAICFIGTADQIRVDNIKKLLQAGLPVHVYGSDWHKYIKPNTHPKLKIGDPVYGVDFWRTAVTYRIQLNIFRPHNFGSHNMRTFEMPALGAIMLAPDSPEHREFFEDGEEVFFYASDEEMIQRALFLLGISTKEANTVRKKAWEKSRKANYTYQDRAKKVFDSLQTLVR